MKTVNLLPDWYLRQQREQRSLRIRLVLLVCLGAIMSGWIGVGRTQLLQLRAQRDELARRSDLARNLGAEVSQREADIRRLENLRLAYRDVGNAIPMSAVVQQVLNDLKPGMALSRVTVDVRKEPIKARTDGEATEAKFHSVARLTVVGIAPNDVLIAQLIGDLSSNPLFTDIALNFTRTELLRDYSVRRFEIQMTMDLERLAIEAPPTQQAAAGEEHHAG